jgi:phage gp36-like protein
MIYEGTKGQVAPVTLAIQFLDGAGTPTNPTAPEAKVFGGSPFALKATVALAQSLGLTGFYMAELDISNAVVWPAGQYVVRGTGTVGAVPTATVDYLQIHPTGAFGVIAGLAGSYTTEARIRAVAKVLEDVVLVPSALVAQKAADGAAYIDGWLGEAFTVPFDLPAPGMIVLLNDWKAAALLLENKQSEAGNLNDMALMLTERVDALLQRILDGTLSIGIDPTESGLGSSIKSNTAEVPPDFVISYSANKAHQTDLRGF